MNSEKIPTRRLSRKQVAEGLKAQPMEHILLGAGNSKVKRLTGKQVAFAEQIALGNTKAGAYRSAYNRHAKPVTQSRRGQEVAASGAVQAQVEAFKLALEAQRYATPAALRALVIERLTTSAIDDAMPPAQRLRALELLGKVTEVAAFTERRELIKTDSASNARERLINSLRTAITTSSGAGGLSLLAELARSAPDNVVDADDVAERAGDDDAVPCIADDAISINALAVSECSPGLQAGATPPHPIPPLPSGDTPPTLA